ncbi:MAG: DNA mismatch repair endonuclease MutL [Anaerolineae bacterium]
MDAEFRKPIQVLPPEVASKIAAGEVVERPASVVKELVENALDAGATDIRVEIRQGGRRLIQVADNGCGIPADEVELAFARHATSKLRDVQDLERIASLGFRGEALASIAAVAQVTLLTRPPEEAVARRVRVEGGRLVENRPAAAPAGTVVTVEHLFYNVPARQKFLRQPPTEAAYIHEVVTRYALAYPERRFELVSDGRSLFLSPGSGRLRDVLAVVLGVETADALLPVEAEGEHGAHLAGFVSPPSLHRASRADIAFFVNRRWIQDRGLSAAVSQAYHTFLPIGRHPVAFLLLEVPPSEVDVNVHPTKREVRFRHGQAIFALVQAAVRKALTAQAPVAATLASEWAPPRWHGTPGPTAPLPGPTAPPGPTTAALWPDGASMPPLRVVGQVALTYIVAEGPDGLYLIDQHAAHERVLYEELVAGNASTPSTQALLDPLPVRLTPSQAAALGEHLDHLRRHGFDLEPFGGDTWLLRGIPPVLHRGDPTRTLVDILDELAEGTAKPLEDSQEARVVASICKQAAVKAGQALSLEEMRELVHRLERARSPRTCPHGRPTMILIQAALLARQFGREG